MIKVNQNSGKLFGPHSGATQYIESKSQNPVEELRKLGGAKIILGTVPSGKAMSEVLGGLAVNGKLIMIGNLIYFDMIRSLVAR
jgi:D-arabinose 1-dehydrogenase-like Zn-dependent alcohol dehydrogenase